MPVNYDQIAARLDERYKYQSFPAIQARLRGLVGPATRVLEIGCGAGHRLSVLSDLPVELVGVGSIIRHAENCSGSINQS